MAIIREDTQSSNKSNGQSFDRSNTTTNNDRLAISLMRAAGKNTTLRAAASELLGRVQFGRGWAPGFESFAGKRDLYEALGYQRNLTVADYRARYERGGIAKTVVDCLPRATWKGKLSIIEQESPNNNSQFERDLESLFEELSIQSILNRADILAGLGRYSILLLGCELGVNEDFSSPLSNLRGVESLLTITPIPEDRAEVVELVGELDPSEISDKRFGLPKYYEVKLGTPRMGVNSQASSVSSLQTVRVHWTRVIHIAEGLLENEIYGEPRLRPVWNLLDDLYKLVGGGSEAAWNRMQPPTIFDAEDDELGIDEKEIQAFKDEIEDVIHRLRPYAFTRGVTPKPLSSDKVNTFRENVNTVIDLIAAVMRIPKRRLLGTERGQLASGQDDDNFNDTVAERRETFAEPLIRQLVNRLVEYNIVTAPSRKDGKFEIIWAEEEELNELEKGNLVGKLAAANRDQSLANKRIILTEDEIRDMVYGLDPLEQEEIVTEEVIKEETITEEDKSADNSP